MNEQERAEEHLKVIRRMMERATIYRAISAPTALAAGLLAMAASVLYSHLPPFHSPLPGAIPQIGGNPPEIPFYAVWIVVLVLTLAINTLFIVSGAKRRNEPVFPASLKAALVALAPAMLVGAASTVLLAEPGQESALDLILAIVWAIFYGLGLLATSHFAPRSLTLLGWAFLLSGVTGLLWMRYDPQFSIDPPPHAASTFMAVTFGFFHLVYAVFVWPRAAVTDPEL